MVKCKVCGVKVLAHPEFKFLHRVFNCEVRKRKREPTEYTGLGMRVFNPRKI